MLEVEEKNRVTVEEIKGGELFCKENLKERRQTIIVLNRTGHNFKRKYNFIVRSLKKSILLKKSINQQVKIFSSERFSMGTGIGTGLKLPQNKNSTKLLGEKSKYKNKNQLASICENINGRHPKLPSINNMKLYKSSKFKESRSNLHNPN